MPELSATRRKIIMRCLDVEKIEAWPPEVVRELLTAYDTVVADRHRMAARLGAELVVRMHWHRRATTAEAELNRRKS